MKFKDALLAAQHLNAEVLIPIKMGFFVKVRPATKHYAGPSIPLALVEKYNLQDVAGNYECNVFEINIAENKVIKEIQDTWLQWSIDENDIHRDTFMLV